MADYKQELMTLMKRDDLKNKNCVDCDSPNPQWASVNHGILFCLSCAGLHRGLGVHISFVRSCTMDTWTPEQLKRMKLGGNLPFLEFMRSYPSDGGYTEGMSVKDKYNCHAAAQYRDKLTATVEGREWSPSPPAAAISDTPGRPSSAQGLRKSRTGSRNVASSSPLRRDSASPSPSQAGSMAAEDRKAANERYFATLGEANANRREDLPPSQGGKYTGFGSTPTPPAGSQHPSFGMSSAAAPSIADFQNDPVAALGKGWSLFSSALIGASRAVNENVIQPGMEKVMDPNFQDGVRGYVAEAGRQASALGKAANDWSKSHIGVDVADQVGGVVHTVRSTVGNNTPGGGYGALPSHGGWEDDHGTRLYSDEGDDFFAEVNHRPGGSSNARTSGTAPAAKGKSDWDNDDWDKDNWDKDDGWNKDDGKWKDF